VPRRNTDRIREKIRLHEYDMTIHAMEEMAEDDPDATDIELTVLGGKFIRIEKSEPRGTKYLVEGLAADGETPLGVLGRFTTTERFLIVTVYAITDSEQ
jgi:hypothetical protein